MHRSSICFHEAAVGALGATGRRVAGPSDEASPTGPHFTVSLKLIAGAPPAQHLRVTNRRFPSNGRAFARLSSLKCCDKPKTQTLNDRETLEKPWEGLWTLDFVMRSFRCSAAFCPLAWRRVLNFPSYGRSTRRQPKPAIGQPGSSPQAA